MLTFSQNKTGITLVALVVTIIVLLILAGITLNLISGTNGILERASKAARLAEISRYSDSKELSDVGVYTDMLTIDTGYTNLYQYIKEKCRENEKEVGDKLFKGDHGTYWIDENENLHYKDDVTENDGTVTKGDQGDLVLKEVITSDGTLNDMTTEDSLRKEIEITMKDLKDEYERSGDTGNFKDFMDKKLEENGGEIKNSDTGGTIKSNEDGTYTYEDIIVPPNTGKITVDADGNVIITDIKIHQPNDDDSSDKTDKDLLEELEKAIQEQKEKQKEEGNTGKFKDYLDKKLEDNGGKIPTPITGGTISKNDDGTYTYEDSETPSNKIIFDIDDDGNITIIEIIPGGGAPAQKPTLPMKTITENEMGFQKRIAGTEEWNPDWINQSVVVTAVPKIDLTGYTIQTSKNKVTWKTVDNQTFVTNGTFYVRLFNGKKYGNVLQTEVTNIDKILPELEVETTTFSYTIKATDEVSKIAGYKITETADEPENFDPVDLQETFTTTGEATPGQTLYAWVRDKAGNIVSKEFTLKEVQAITNDDLTYKFEPEGWINQDVQVTVEPKPGVIGKEFTLQTSKDGINWEAVTNQTFTENGKMFVRLVDARGNPGKTTAETIIDKIDKMKPEVITVTATTKSYQFEARDEDAGLVGYKVTETDEEPTSFEKITSGEKTFTSPIIDNQKNSHPYYIWLKDVAGNVSRTEFNLKAVEAAAEANITKSTVWNATRATVTFGTTSTYQIQTCTTASRNEADWKNENVVTVESGTTIYVRLWDGVNGGNYFTFKPVLTYQVAYNVNGGTGTMSNSVHEFGAEKALNANTFKKTGYTFTGWATSAGGAKIYNDRHSVTNLSSTNGSTVTLYAVWTPNTNTPYKVIHQKMNVNGSGYTVFETENKTGTSDANVTPPVKSYTGFTSPTAKSVKVAADGSTTLTYNYTRNRYRFTLGSATGVSTSGSSGTGDYYYEASITLRAAASAGYTFNQWTSNNTGLTGNKTTANTSFSMPAGAVTLTPKATANTNTPYKVVHQLMNVYGTGYYTQDTENKTGTTDADVSPDVKSYTGFTSPAKKTVKISGNGNTTITYQYTRNKYTITYNSNGGSACNATTAYYGGSVSMPTPSRSGYTFKGWSQTYTSMPAQNVTVTANWEQEPTGVNVIKGSNYGDKVNYGNVNGCSNWKVFLNDGNNVYLIAGDVVNNGNLPLVTPIMVNGYTYVFSGDGLGATLVNWMTTTSRWSSYVKGTYADQATGGPTLDQFVKSVNGKLGKNYTTETIRNYDYWDELYRCSNNSWWLATPHATKAEFVYYFYRGTAKVAWNMADERGEIANGGNDKSVRPLVRLKSNVEMAWNGSAWDLSV